LGTPRTLDQAVTNLEQSISLIPQRYEQGINRGKWADAAASDQAETNFNQAMSKALQAKSRQTGVRRVGDTVWRAGALNKGVSRIGPGLSDALPKYRENFGKVYTAILSAQAGLPARTIDPIQNIDRRLKPIVAAAVAARIRGR